MLTVGPSCSPSPQAPILIIPKGFLLLPIIRSTHTGSLPLLMSDLLGHAMHGHPGGADRVQGDGFPSGGTWCWRPQSRTGPSLPPSCVL